MKDRLGHLTERLGRLGARRRLSLGEKLFERLLGLLEVLTGRLVREAADRRRSHARIGVGEAPAHELGTLTLRQLGHRLDRRRTNVRVVVGDALLDQRQGVAPTAAPQHIEHGSAHLGVVMMQQEGRNQMATMVGVEQLDRSTHLARVGAAEALHQNLERRHVADVDARADARADRARTRAQAFT